MIEIKFRVSGIGYRVSGIGFNMEAKAISKYVRISPRKTRLVMDIIRNKGTNDSMQILEVMNKRAARVINKVLASAVANAKQKELNMDNLWIKKAVVDGGPVYKRYMPRAMGRATMIRKPTSHITIILSDEKERPKIEVKTRGVAEEKREKKPRFGKMRRQKAERPKKVKKIKGKEVKSK